MERGKTSVKVLIALVVITGALFFVSNLQAQCGGQITLSATSLEWSAVQVGAPSQQTVEIFNGGPDDLCISNVTSTSHAWLVAWDPVPIPAGGISTMYVDFAPGLDRDYFGTIEIFSSDESHPRDSIRVQGTACQAGLPPGEPVIVSVPSPYMFYYSIPLDENQASVDYALQLTSIPEGEISYGKLDGSRGADPQFLSRNAVGYVKIWAVGDLAPFSTYEVKLLTRDCLGNVYEGPPVLVTTTPEIHEAAIESLTVNIPASDGPAVLRWNPDVTDVDEISLPFDGYFVYAGDHPDSINTLYAESVENYIELPVEDAKKFFQVYARTNGTYFGLAPFFPWPPANADLYGVNTVSLRDPANWTEWSSVQIEIDSSGEWVELLSLGPDDLPGREGVDIIVDFDQYGVGLRTIQAHVTDVTGLIYTVLRTVNVVQRPYAEFTASYEPLSRTFTLLATNISTPAPFFDLWWPISTVDERYGPAIQFESKAGEPELHIVKPIPILPATILNEEQPWPLPSDATYGVVVNDEVPGQFQVVGAVTPASPCCVGIEVAYFKSNLEFDSCFVSCAPSGQNEGSKTCRAGCRFAFNILWEWHPGTFNAEWEVQSKYTESHWDGTCSPGPGGPVFEAAVGNAHTKTKDFKNQHGYAGATTAKLNGKKAVKPQKSGTDDDGVPYGKTSAWTSDKNGKEAEPVAQHRKDTALKNKKSMAVRIKGDYYFRVIAIDECPGADCDEEYNVHFDVVCCEDCTTIVTTAPSVESGP